MTLSDVDRADVVYNPFRHEVQDDPYDIYRLMRDEAPNYYDVEHGFYALSRYDDVLAAYQDNATYSNSHGITLEPVASGVPGILTCLDDPEHAAYRRLVFKVFTPRSVRDLEPYARQRAAEILEPAREGGELDGVDEYSAILPLSTICQLLGIPQDESELLREVADRSLSRGDGETDMNADAIAAMIALQTQLLDLMALRRKKPADDLISGMAAITEVEVVGKTIPVPPEETANRLMELSLAGYDTLARTVGNGLLALYRHPDQRRELVEDVSLIPNTFEEVMRWEAAFQFSGRWTTRDVELHGSVIPAERRVLLLIGSANRDERVWDDPEKFDIHRQIDRQIGFGSGVHLCTGTHLARMQGRVMLEELLSRFPNYEIAEDRLVRSYSTNFRGYQHVPLILNP